MIKPCFFCEKITYTPFHVTEVSPSGEATSYDMCKECGSEYLGDDQKMDKSDPLPREPDEELDLSHISSPQELIEFMSSFRRPVMHPCECGLTEEEFDEIGKFGCAKCYQHFEAKMEELVYPWHGAREHVGKRPMRQIREQWEATTEEKIKLLKLRYAKALELEEYEKLEGLQKEIDDLKISPSSASGDQ